jgi:hypothetical protein
METKVCSKCGVRQNVLEFRKDITKKDGLRPDCKLCVKSYEMSRRANNPDMMKEKLKTYYKDNPEKRKKYRENYKLRKQQQRKDRRNSDPVFNLINRIRCRVWKYLNVLNITKKNKTFDIVGCSPEFLKEHLEKQFTDGMTWELFGKHIHIDHIIPLSSAKTEDELYKLCHYTNLQPLWAEDNLKKSNKILVEQE